MASEAFEANRVSPCKKCQVLIKVGERVRWAGKGVVQHERCSSAWREAQQHPNGPILPLLQQAKEPAPELTREEWDALLAFDDATSSVPMVEGKEHADRGELSDDAGDRARTGARLPVPAVQPAATDLDDRGADEIRPAAQTLAPASADLVAVVRELRSTVGGLAATVRVLATAVEYIAKAIPPDRYLVPADHWTRKVEATDAGRELATGDPL